MRVAEARVVAPGEARVVGPGETEAGMVMRTEVGTVRTVVAPEEVLGTAIPWARVRAAAAVAVWVS